VSFTPERLRAALGTALRHVAPPAQACCLALSGGLDSTVLLVALVRLREADAALRLRAIHVDHGLQADSTAWSCRCLALAARYGIDCEIVCVDARAGAGESPEAAARAARYRALGERLGRDEVLLTAHHADDQLESVLLQGLRGGGLRALAGMRAATPFAQGWHVRPLLGFTRAELHEWALRQGLDWLEDPTNLDERFDRNYLRLAVLPALRRRWPAAALTIGRVADQAAEALELDEEAAAADLAGVAAGETLPLAGLRAFGAPRQRRLLRAWLRARGLPLPSAATLGTLLRDMLVAAPDRVPESRWPGAVVRRYRDRLYADRQAPTVPDWAAGAWVPGETFSLGPLGRLELCPTIGQGLSRARLGAPLRVVPRLTGAVFRPADSAHRRQLRKWLQERGVLPWRRALLPLVCVDGEIAAVADLGCDARFAASPGEAGWRIVWHGRPALTEDEAVASRSTA